MSDGEYWDRDSHTWRQAGTGRTEAEQRAFERGYEQAGDRFTSWSSKSSPAAGTPDGLPSFTSVAAQFPVVLPRGDRGEWARTTVAGALAQVVAPDQPDDAAREMAEARAFCDRWEYTYGRRPSMPEARMATCRRSDGVVISGTTAEIAATFAQAGLGFTILTSVKPLPPPADAVVRRTVA